MFIIFSIFALLAILPTIFALVDILRSDFHGDNKLIWIIVVLFMNFIGAILYFIIGVKQKIR